MHRQGGRTHASTQTCLVLLVSVRSQAIEYGVANGGQAGLKKVGHILWTACHSKEGARCVRGKRLPVPRRAPLLHCTDARSAWNGVRHARRCCSSLKRLHVLPADTGASCMGCCLCGRLLRGKRCPCSFLCSCPPSATHRQQRTGHPSHHRHQGRATARPRGTCARPLTLCHHSRPAPATAPA